MKFICKSKLKKLANSLSNRTLERLLADGVYGRSKRSRNSNCFFFGAGFALRVLINENINATSIKSSFVDRLHENAVEKKNQISNNTDKDFSGFEPAKHGVELLYNYSE